MRPPQANQVSNEPIREAVKEYMSTHNLSWVGMASRAGIYTFQRSLRDKNKKYKVGDSGRLKRMLGVNKHVRTGPGYVTWIGHQTNMSYDNAVRLVRAIERDPVDFDL